ncbi:methionine--tRNA ligase subunit beta [Candidatus Parcubacteria bacterium]|nr:MAG: methionine--tRNA ligase subunit beta [Candidatus Parcubacteria bacterium]
MIPFDDFKKIDLRAGTIREAERVEGSEKLLKLRVDLGAEIGERQILAGIGKRYEPDTLIGRQIIIVANLEPRALMGLESQGMLLAADSGDGPALLVPDREVPPGASIR